jgi:hypothetical protein
VKYFGTADGQIWRFLPERRREVRDDMVSLDLRADFRSR